MQVGGKIDLEQAILALESFKEVEAAATNFWKELDQTIVKPRTILQSGVQPGVTIDGVRILDLNAGQY
jgi:hypothetical protein